MTAPRVAVLVPCYNEEAAIRQVVVDFKAALPEAIVYVYDNNSTDGTIAAAKAAGAVVRTEKMRGKGNVVRRMYADIEADVYVLVDGDDTYEAAASRAFPLLRQSVTSRRRSYCLRAIIPHAIDRSVGLPARRRDGRRLREDESNGRTADGGKLADRGFDFSRGNAGGIGVADRERVAVGGGIA